MPRHSRPLIILGLAAAILVGGCSAATTSGGTSAIREVGPAEAVRMLEDRTVIDVRTAAEYADGHVGGALNIDVEADDFQQQIASLDRTAPYLVYCNSGRRSAIAAETMARAGFTDIVDAGGLDPLLDAGAPTE
jgi:rhodanese-related sulfurtransferase